MKLLLALSFSVTVRLLLASNPTLMMPANPALPIAVLSAVCRSPTVALASALTVAKADSMFVLSVLNALSAFWPVLIGPCRMLVSPVPIIGRLST